MIDAFHAWANGLIVANWWQGAAWPVLWTLMKIIAVTLPVMGAESRRPFGLVATDC
jgi:NADH-quinone oxidoreductase subunit H